MEFRALLGDCRDTRPPRPHQEGDRPLFTGPRHPWWDLDAAEEWRGEAGHHPTTVTLRASCPGVPVGSMAASPALACGRLPPLGKQAAEMVRMCRAKIMTKLRIHRILT